MKRHLHIADPCSEHWDSMGGSATRRRCDRCDKHVHHLSEMTPAEAERLLASAPHGGLCIRVEHDDDGRVRFRGEASARFRLAVGASLLLAACGRAEPPQASPEPRAEQGVHEAAASPPPAAPGAAPGAAPAGSAVSPVGQAPPAAASCAPATSGSAGAGNSPTRVTMGCVCAPGDTVCDCL